MNNMPQFFIRESRLLYSSSDGDNHAAIYLQGEPKKITEARLQGKNKFNFVGNKQDNGGFIPQDPLDDDDN